MNWRLWLREMTGDLLRSWSAMFAMMEGEDRLSRGQLLWIEYLASNSLNPKNVGLSTKPSNSLHCHWILLKRFWKYLVISFYIPFEIIQYTHLNVEKMMLYKTKRWLIELSKFICNHLQSRNVKFSSGWRTYVVKLVEMIWKKFEEP